MEEEVQMEKEVMTFLVELATSPGRLSEYLNDREAYLERTALSPEARAAVLSGDQDKIATLAGNAEWAMHTKKKPKPRPMYKKKKKKKKAKKKKVTKKKVAKKKATKKKVVKKTPKKKVAKKKKAVKKKAKKKKKAKTATKR